jgi:hypothetical protein
VILYFSKCGTVEGYIDRVFEEAEQLLLAAEVALREPGEVTPITPPPAEILRRTVCPITDTRL